MKPQSQGRVIFWLMLCTLVLLIAAAADYSISQGASADTFPLPVNVPVPASVLAKDNFAKSMSIDGDTLVVGAPWTDVNGAEQQGLVYIYTRSGSDPTAFTLLKSITGSDSSAHHDFGWVVGIHGDTLVVGNANGSDGAAYIFERNQGGANNWGEVKKLVRDDTHTFTHYGRNVAIHGDTVVVAAPLGLGDVFIYRRDQDGANQWGKTQTLDSGLPITTSVRTANFGENLAFDGETLVISAPGLGLAAQDVPNGSPVLPRNFVGSVFIYRQDNGQWLPDGKLFSSDIVLGGTDLLHDVYGASLALKGDTLFVAATGGLTNGVFTGKVFVLQRGAGTPPPFGQPGPWGEIAELSPSDGVDNDNFGRALYAVDDGLFVSSEKQGVGQVYFFRNPSGLAGSATVPQASLAWSGVYTFTSGIEGTSQFGFPLTGSDNSVVMGERSATGQGGVSAYAKDALFAYDPNAEPSPTPSETPTATATPPIDPGPCVYFYTQSASANLVYLPALSRGSGDVNTLAASAHPARVQASEAITPVVRYLAPGCAVSGPGGLKIGAVEGAITQTVVITMQIAAAPSEALPAGALPAGEYLRVSSAKNEHTDMETPFVIGVSVPSNVDSSHLALVHLLPATHSFDSQASGNLWGYLPGVYDVASGLFLARMPFLLAEGTTFMLVEHPDFDSPPNQPAVQPAAVDVRGEFSVFCITSSFNRSSDCGATLEADAKAALDEIYQRMTDPAIFGFPRKLRLLDSGSQFIVSETISVTALTASYVAYIQGPKDPNCAGPAGYYNVDTGFLALCADAGDTFDMDDKETMIHEFFHAIEFTYPSVYEDDFWGFLEKWITEGMAEAAVKSYPVNKMQRSPYFGADNLQKVDQALTTGVGGDAALDEYLAQDFWVYVGASESKSLSYLGPLLTTGGAHQLGIDRALKTFYNKSLGEFYWEWVKNQTVENAYDIGVSPGVLCELSEEALLSAAPVEFPASEEFYPFNMPSIYDTLPPLTAKVIEIKFGAKTGALVTMEYQGCVGLQDPVAKASCVTAAQQTLRSKIYVEGETQCTNDNLPGVSSEGIRQLTGISAAKRYFVVVANADLHDDHGYFVAIE